MSLYRGGLQDDFPQIVGFLQAGPIRPLTGRVSRGMDDPHRRGVLPALFSLLALLLGAAAGGQMPLAFAPAVAPVRGPLATRAAGPRTLARAAFAAG